MKFLGAVLVLLGLTGPALAAEATPTPDGVVTEMYTTYFDALNAANASDAMDNMPSCIDQTVKYATPELAARLAKTESTDEMVIDWDFLVNGQDFKDLKVVSVKVTSETADAATVRIETMNFETVSETDVQLTKSADGWKVANLVFWPGKPETTSLDDVLKEAGL
ncbi:MAG: DUF3828 domain-containing protein [Micropepsaceae bacterium]